MLIDGGQLIRQGGGWSAASDLTQVAVPPTIHALLSARLDGLPAPERQVLERGSVEGKVFHRGAIAELAPDALRESVPTHLRTLARKELVRPERADFAGDEAFRFRHLLIRDAAYGAMPKETLVTRPGWRPRSWSAGLSPPCIGGRRPCAKRSAEAKSWVRPARAVHSRLVDCVSSAPSARRQVTSTKGGACSGVR